MFNILVSCMRRATPRLIEGERIASTPFRGTAWALLFVGGLGLYEPGRLRAEAKEKTATDQSAAVTEEEAKAFAEALTEAVSNRDIKQCNKLVDWDAIFDAATLEPDSPQLKEAREEFKIGAVESIQKKGGILALAGPSVEQGGSYKCLRVNAAQQPPYALLRVHSAEEGLNYHKLMLGRNSAGQVVATDIYIFLTGERFSETMHRSWLPVARAQLQAGGDQSKVKEDPFIEALVPLKLMNDLINKKKNVAALKIFQQLPSEMRKNKSTLLMRLKAAKGISDDEYALAIDDLKKCFPQDAALELILIDGYVIREQFDEALKCIDRLDKSIGGDAMLGALRANMLLQLKRIPEARKAIEAALRAEPDLEEAYTTGLDVAMADRQFDEVAKYLDKLEQDFGYEWKDLKEVPEFAEFVKSPAYQKWLDSREKK